VPDWEQFVGHRLGARFAAAHPEIVLELSGHLEEKYEDLRGQGLAAARAERRALAEVSNWTRLRNDLERSREGDSSMTQQIRCVWLPGLLSSACAFGMLRVVLALSATSWAFQRRVTEMFPALTPGGPGAVFATFWLVVLPLAGALGAYVSWRAGGRPGQRVFAAVIPALVVAGIALLALGVALATGEVSWHGNPFPGFVMWLLLPAVASALGTIPFLRLSTHDAQRS